MDNESSEQQQQQQQQDSSQEKEIDVSVNWFCWLLAFPCSCGSIPYRETLYFGDDELTVTEISLCGLSQIQVPYSELGSVDHYSCLCWKSASTSFGSISPGCGCNDEEVKEIVNELRKRIHEIGTITQIRKHTEQTCQRLDIIEKKIDIIMETLNIPPITNDKMKDRDI